MSDLAIDWEALADRHGPETVEQVVAAAVAAELERIAHAEAVGVNEDGHRWRAVSTEDLFMRAAELRDRFGVRVVPEEG